MIDSIQLSTESMGSRIMQQEVIANNLANVNTVGFKRDRVFQEVLTDATVQSGAEIAKVTVFEQGALRETKNVLDFAIVGDGFFVVKTAEGIRYTRNGNFQLDSSGQLVLEEGILVMGEKGPIEVNGEVAVNEQGEVYLNGAITDKFRIVTFEKPFQLKKLGNSLFVLDNDQYNGLPGNNVQIKQGFLEDSNVNPIEEMVNMMTIFRYFEADQKAIHAHDQILNRAANDVGRVP